MLPSLGTALVARHFRPGHAAIRDCRQSMSDQTYCRAWAAAVLAARTRRMQHASLVTMHMIDPQQHGSGSADARSYQFPGGTAAGGPAVSARWAVMSADRIGAGRRLVGPSIP